MIYKILGLFAATLTPHNKDSLRHWENLPQAIQIQLSKTQKAFSQFLVQFLKSISIFERFEKKHDPQSLCISKIIDC